MATKSSRSRTQKQSKAFSTNPKAFLRPLNSPASGEDEVVLEFLNFYHREGLIPETSLEPLRGYYHQRLELLTLSHDRLGPDDLNSSDFMRLLDTIREATESTLFARYGDQTVLYDTADGHVLQQQVQSGKTIGDFLENSTVQAELFAEILIMIIGMVAAGTPDGLKGAAKATSEKLIKNPSVREIIIKVLKAIFTAKKLDLEEIRKLLLALFRLIKGELWDMVKGVFTKFSWKDIIAAIIDILLWFTPVGWVKKAATVSVGFIMLGLRLDEKFEKFKKGTL